MATRKIAKGDLTRKLILDTARGIFNEKGIYLTLDNLAGEMEVPKGRITNHFSTKDKLFLAILDDYEEKLAEKIRELYQHYLSRSLMDVFHLINSVMDLQYEYRCTIIYLNVLSPGQAELRDQINLTAIRSREAIKKRMEVMVMNKLLREELLEPENLESFLFIYINQMTQWVIYKDMYDHDKDYKAVKPFYIKAILYHVYGPYLTAKGRKELEGMGI